jgi:hypothetical protein
VTPTRLREIAQQLVNNCSAYQEKIMQSGSYTPCKTCFAMAEELREHAKKMGPRVVVPKATAAVANDVSS